MYIWNMKYAIHDIVNSQDKVGIVIDDTLNPLHPIAAKCAREISYPLHPIVAKCARTSLPLFIVIAAPFWTWS